MTQKISMILAYDKDGGIGKDGKLPWNYRDDMRFFVKMTKGATCIMGRRTYEEIFNKLKPHPTITLLPRRTCIVLSRNQDFRDQVERNSLHTYGAESLDEALRIATRQVFIIGGAYLYNAAINIADEVYITHIKKSYDCDTYLDDTFFKSIDNDFVCETIDFNTKENNANDLCFTKYIRK